LRIIAWLFGGLKEGTLHMSKSGHLANNLASEKCHGSLFARHHSKGLVQQPIVLLHSVRLKRMNHWGITLNVWRK
jgi:hypothetical protein